MGILIQTSNLSTAYTECLGCKQEPEPWCAQLVSCSYVTHLLQCTELRVGFPSSGLTNRQKVGFQQNNSTLSAAQHFPFYFFSSPLFPSSLTFGSQLTELIMTCEHHNVCIPYMLCIVIFYCE